MPIITPLHIVIATDPLLSASKCRIMQTIATFAGMFLMHRNRSSTLCPGYPQRARPGPASLNWLSRNFRFQRILSVGIWTDHRKPGPLHTEEPRRSHRAQPLRHEPSRGRKHAAAGDQTAPGKQVAQQVFHRGSTLLFPGYPGSTGDGRRHLLQGPLTVMLPAGYRPAF